ncbi:MAG: SRPBCC domain-containing protein [Pseudomonadota bacterium]
MNMARHPLKVTVRRTIQASAGELFDAWLDPASLSEWMRPGNITRAVTTLDPRVGGKFEIVMHAPDGAHVHSGVYRLIDRPHRLVFTWISRGTKNTETLVTIDFYPTDIGTEIVLTHEQLPDEAAVQSHTRGWMRILQVFAQAMEAKS